MNVQNCEGLQFLSEKIKDNTVDLILTDPPYIISHETGMEKYKNAIEEASGANIKTEQEWLDFKKIKKYKDDTHKNNYIKFGSIYGKKYCVTTNYGDWDKEFSMEELEYFVKEYYQKLKQGGTLIIWFDIWKLSALKEILEKHKFKQIRFIEWIKTNPQPLNSNVNYLTNCREIALLGIKGSKPTFNSKMDKGIYEFPMAAGWYKFHPTQKNLELFKTIIEKHSNEGDTVLDTFLGGGTTAYACKETKRNFIGCEINPEFFGAITQNLNKYQKKI